MSWLSRPLTVAYRDIDLRLIAAAVTMTGYRTWAVMDQYAEQWRRIDALLDKRIVRMRARGEL